MNLELWFHRSFSPSFVRIKKPDFLLSTEGVGVDGWVPKGSFAHRSKVILFLTSTVTYHAQ